MTTIIAVKLISGEELLGKVKLASSNGAGNLSAQDVFTGRSQTEYFNPASGFQIPDSVTLEDVRVLHLQQGPDGQVGLGLVPWMLSNPDSAVTLNLKQVATAVYAPAPKIEQHYAAQTSNIALASTMPKAPPAASLLKG